MAVADALLLTGGDDVPVPDPESGLLVAAFADRAVRAELVAWNVHKGYLDELARPA